MAGKQKVAVIKPSAPLSPAGSSPDFSGKQPERISYFHCDVLGSVVAITDEVGLIKEANIYGPFGEAEFSYKGKFYQDYGFDNRYGYTGQEQDTPGGLMYYGARWYDSEIGRFISEDPATAEPENPLSVNRYMYCLNNPLIYTDPTGLKADGWAIFAVIALSIVTGGLAGMALAGAIGGAAGAAIGVLAGAVVGNYTSGFASASMSGASFSESTHAGSVQVTQSNYVLTVITAGIVYFCYVPPTPGAQSTPPGGKDLNGTPSSSMDTVEPQKIGDSQAVNPNANSGDFQNPTGGSIRGTDKLGSGAYKAARDGGARLHDGVDYAGKAGTKVKSIFSSGGDLVNGTDGVVITAKAGGQEYKAIVTHITSTAKDGAIQGNTVIGKVNDFTGSYPGITNHAHVELYMKVKNTWTQLDPSKYIP